VDVRGKNKRVSSNCYLLVLVRGESVLADCVHTGETVPYLLPGIAMSAVAWACGD